jgi:hypothetical protein
MDLCGPSFPCATPTKRAVGPCTCGADWRAHDPSPATHTPDCPALYRRQPTSGDEPDALTRLVRHARAAANDVPIAATEWETAAWALISEVRTEMRAMQQANDDLRSGTENLQRVVRSLTAGQQSASEARQAAFRELAEELMVMPPNLREGHLRRVFVANGGES